MNITLTNLKNSVQTVTAKNEQFLLQNVKAEYRPGCAGGQTEFMLNLRTCTVQKRLFELLFIESSAFNSCLAIAFFPTNLC
jgi:hypothetical protein